MPVRIVTWNVNGIRNPFKYSPWNKERNLQAMFDILGADIVCFQEVKTAKANLTDELVFVPGWDTFYSFPQSQTGYSGVAVFTRDRKCVPIRVEEGVTGILRIPGSTTRYVDLPADEQIGGYPTDKQLLQRRQRPLQQRQEAVPREVLDSEGRCLVLEFPLFVLINVYCPARRNEQRTGFRNSFLVALDARVRNLAATGKNVILVGDMNVMRDHLDSAEVWGHQGRKLAAEALAFDENYLMLRAVRILNRLTFHSREVGVDTVGGDDNVDGSGSGDAGSNLLTSSLPPPILYDTCRERFPHRKGMYTCWDTRKNHRPANYGSRIDFVLCSPKIMQRLVADANIQPELLGSDHCPVYVDLRDHIQDEQNKELEQGQYLRNVFVLDYLNPPGRFVQGAAAIPADKDAALLSKRFPQSARRLAQFNNRRHIANMFKQTTKPQLFGALAAAGASLAESASASASAHQTQQLTSANTDNGGTVANVSVVKSCLPDILRADVVELVNLSGGEDDDNDDGDQAEENEEEYDEAGRDNEGADGFRLDKTDSSSVPVQAGTEKASTCDGNSMHRKPEADDSVDVLLNGPLPSQSQSQSHQSALRRPSLLRSYSSAISPLPPPAPLAAALAPASASRSRPLKRPKLSATASSKGDLQLTIGMFWLPRDKGPGGDNIITSNSSRSNGDNDSGNNGASNSNINTTGITRPTTDAVTHRSPQTPKRKRPMTPSPQKMPYASSSRVFMSPSQSPSESIALLANAEGATVPGYSPGPADTACIVNTTGIDAGSATNLTTTGPYPQHHHGRVQAARTMWSQLGLGQQQAPLCEHGEPCKMLVTRKAGVNNGRSFYTCARPPGPLGRSEKGTTWQCPTFVWCRDWKPNRKD